MRKVLFVLVVLFTIFAMPLKADWEWAKQATGCDFVDTRNSIDVDKAGNQYITGHFSGTASFGAITLISNGDFDIFIAKLDVNGNFLWAKKFGGNGKDKGVSIKVDAEGNQFITGVFSGTAIFGTTTLISNGAYDVFIIKLDINGNFLWAKKAGGVGNDNGNSIVLDSQGNCYITGCFYNSISFGTINLTSNDTERTIFITKLDNNGSFLWAKKTDGDYYGSYPSIAIDTNANLYITNSSDYYAFIAKIDCNGNFLWIKDRDQCSMVQSKSIAVDRTGNLYTTGYGSWGGIWIAKYDYNGNYLWGKNSNGQSVCSSIAFDAFGNSYITGYFMGSASFGSIVLTSSSSFDIFIAKLDFNGNFIWAKKLMKIRIPINMVFRLL